MGAEALSLILKAMVLSAKTSLGSILDMPCGYGRVLRHIVVAFPESSICACELDRAKLDFCQREFGAIPVESTASLSGIDFRRSFDLIWSGSLVTHLPEPLFYRAIDVLVGALAPGGVALITVHGRNGLHMLFEHPVLEPARMSTLAATYEATGFGYVDYEWASGYGLSVVRPSLLLSHLEDNPGVSIRGYLERGWDDRQDVVIVQKTPHPPRLAEPGSAPQICL